MYNKQGEGQGDFMKLDIGRILRKEVSRFRVNMKETLDYIDTSEGRIHFCEEILIQGEINSIKDKIYLELNVKTAVKESCGRCLKDVIINIDTDLQGFLTDDYKESVDELEDSFIYDGDEVNMDEVLKTAVLLNLPSKIVCKDDCKGICPNCGNNLNEEGCKCNPDEIDELNIDPRLSKLKDFFK
ncbi:DUF177 domain-containing protein [Peptostreptococcaceae bacterium AGR-M142]